MANNRLVERIFPEYNTMSEETDHELLMEWRTEREQTIDAFRRLALSLEDAHKENAMAEKKSASVSLVAGISGLAGVVFAPVSAGVSLAATAFTAFSTIGSMLVSWNANKKDKETSEQIKQELGQHLRNDKKASARFEVLLRNIEYLKEQLHILKIDEIATSLHGMSALTSESNTTDNNMTFTSTAAFLNKVKCQDRVNTVKASNVVRTGKLFLERGALLRSTCVVKEAKDVSRTLTYAQESSDVLKAASIEGKQVANQVRGMSAAASFKDIKDISETVTESSDTIRTVTKVVKDAKYAKVVKKAKDMSETVKSVKDTSDVVRESSNVVTKVNEISDAVIGLKETKYAAKAATKALKDVRDISETVKSTKEASNTLTTATKAIREVKDAPGVIKKMTETSDSVHTAAVIKGVKSNSGTVTSIKETSDAVKTVALAKELKGVSKTAKSLQESSAVVETISHITKDATSKVVNNVKSISETVRNTKETSNVVKTATKLTKDVAASTKQVTISATKTGQAMSSFKTVVTGTDSSVRTLNSVKEASNTVKTASKVAKDSTSAVRTTSITKSVGGAGAVSKSAASVSKFGLAMSAVFIPLDIYNLYQANKGLSQSYEDVDTIRKDVRDFENDMVIITTLSRKDCDYFQKVFNLLCKQYRDHRIKEVYQYLLLLHDKLGFKTIPRLPGERVWTESMESITVSNDPSLNRGTKQFCLKMFLSEIFTPLYWASFHSDKSVKQWQISEEVQSAEILVDVDDQTFLAVKTLVQSTWEHSKVGMGHDAKGLRELNMNALKVKKVQRIENMTLYGKYCQRRQEVFYKAAKVIGSGISRNKGTMIEKYLNYKWKDTLYEEVNEGYFFHGTRSDIVTNVLKQGLDPRMSNGGSAIGQGIYMAESSTKADQYADKATNRQTKGLQMFLVRACLGNTCTLKEPRKLKRPPCCIADCFSDACGHENRHDSVVLEKFIFREFVAFESPLIYPEYLITYDRVA